MQQGCNAQRGTYLELGVTRVLGRAAGPWWTKSIPGPHQRCAPIGSPQLSIPCAPEASWDRGTEPRLQVCLGRLPSQGCQACKTRSALSKHAAVHRRTSQDDGAGLQRVRTLACPPAPACAGHLDCTVCTTCCGWALHTAQKPL